MDRVRGIINESVRRVLKEYAGVFIGCQQLAQEIITSIRKYGWDMFPPTERLCFEVPVSWAPHGCVQVTVKNVQGCNAVYLPSILETYGTVFIIVSPSAAAGKEEYLLPTLVHELTHAYEDCMRLKNGGKSIARELQDHGYDISLDYNTRTPYPKKDATLEDVARFNQYSVSFERNARAATIIPLLMSAEKVFETPNDAYLYLEECRPYRTLLFLKGFTESIMHPESEDEKQEYLDAFNKITKLRFSSYGKLQRYCQQILKKYENKLADVSRKAIHFYFSHKKPKQVSRIDNLINWKDSLRRYGR